MFFTEDGALIILGIENGEFVLNLYAGSLTGIDYVGTLEECADIYRGHFDLEEYKELAISEISNEFLDEYMLDYYIMDVFNANTKQAVDDVLIAFGDYVDENYELLELRRIKEEHEEKISNMALEISILSKNTIIAKEDK